MRFASRKSFSPHPRGSVLIFAIIISVVLTGLVMSLSFSQGLQTQETSSLLQLDQGFFAAEAGAQRVLWQWKHNSYTWRSTGTWTMSVADTTAGAPSHTWTQTYSCQPHLGSATAFDISCTAVDGSSSSQTVVAFLATPPGTGTPVMSAGSAGNISGAVTITGDCVTQSSLNGGSSLTITGNLTSGAALNSSPSVGGNCQIVGDDNGSGHIGGNLILTGNLNSSPTVGGNVSANGVINGNPTAGGTKTAHASNTVTIPAGPNITTMINSEKALADAAHTFNNPSSMSVLNFVGAANNVILINGDCNLSSVTTINGTGTLIVTGNFNQSSRFPATGTATINLLVAGDINGSGGLYINGGLYTAEDWNESGNFSVTGVTAVTGNYNVSGSGSLVLSSLPSFDTRTSSSSSIGIAETAFTGPVP